MMPFIADLFINSRPPRDRSSPPSLASGDVHVWRFRYNSVAFNAPPWIRRLLAADELETASRLVFQDDQTRFLLRRAFVRIILGIYVGIAPQNLSFRKNKWGKPSINGLDTAGIEFNVSHTKSLVLLALTKGAPLGIDVEQLDCESNPQFLAPDVLASKEQSILAESALSDRKTRFLRLWCRKEACLKAIGIGLINDLATLDVSEDIVVNLVEIIQKEGLQKEGFREWTSVHLEDLNIDPDHFAALSKAALSAPVSHIPFLERFSPTCVSPEMDSNR